jgi:hypothetical protein
MLVPVAFDRLIEVLLIACCITVTSVQAQVSVCAANIPGTVQSSRVEAGVCHNSRVANFKLISD